MFFVGLVASAAYWPGVVNAAMAPRWALLAVLLPWLWASLSVLGQPSPSGGRRQHWTGLGSFSSWAFWQWLLRTALQPSLRNLWIGAAAGLTVSSGIAIAEFLHYPPLREVYPWPAGLFVNGNYMAEAAALVVVALVVERLWWLIPSVLPALVLPQARGAILALAVALMLHFRVYWRVMAPIAALAFIGICAFSFLKGDASSVERWALWRSAAHGLTFWGHGTGSFWTAFHLYDVRINPATMPEAAHNEFLTIAFELGVVGVALMAGFFLSLTGPLDAPRLVVIALLVEASFAFPLHLPATAVLGMVAAGFSVRSRYVLRDYYSWRRGTDAPGLGDRGLSAIHATPAVGAATVSVRPPLSRLPGSTVHSGALS